MIEQSVARHKSLSRRRAEGERGFALVVVIVVLLLASFLASQLVLLVRTELKISHNIKARVIGHFLAEAGLSTGLFRLFDRPLEPPDFAEEGEWEKFFEGYEYELFLPKGRVAYYLVNESGKIDLNKSNQELLRLFLEYQLGGAQQEEPGEQEEQIDTIIAALTDWRDGDDFYSEVNGQRGAESETYEALDDPYVARNGPIADPAEFFLLNGTEPLRGKFQAQEIFTVHNDKGGGRINFNSLSPAMLDFLAGGDKEMVQTYRAVKKEFAGTLSASLAAEILGEERYAELQSFLTYNSSGNNFYTLVGIGYAGLEQGAELEEVPEGTGKGKMPGTMASLLIEKKGGGFSRLAWQERSTLLR